MTQVTGSLTGAERASPLKSLGAAWVLPPARVARTMRLAFPCLVLVLLQACSKQKPDPTLVQVTTPIAASVRTHARPAPCQQRELLERAKCWVTPARAGCTYLELGSAPAPSSAPETRSENEAAQVVGRDLRCSLPSTGARVGLSSNVERNVELKVDELGQRLAVRLPNGWSVFYVDDGQVLARSGAKLVPGAPFDWRDIDPVDHLLPEMIAASTGAQHERLVARMIERGGEPGMVTYLATDPDQRPEWDERFAHLSPPGQAEVQRRLVSQLDGGAGPWEFLIARPSLQPVDFAERVASQALTLTGESEGEQLWVWGELARTHHPRAAELACEALHRAFLEQTLTPYDGSGSGNDDRLQWNEGALALIALTRAPCPWVTTLFEQSECSSPIGCSVNGDSPWGEQTQGEVLCTASDADAGLQQWLATLELDAGTDDPTADDAEVDDGGVREEPWDNHTRMSAIFYGALMAQPTRPVLTRRLRAGFPLVTPKGSTEVTDFDAPCTEMLESRGLSNLCSLPASVTSFELRGCQVDIDDARHRVVLRAHRPR